MPKNIGGRLYRQLFDRWQWLCLLGILAFFNFAADDKCYDFRIEPSLVLMDIRDFRRELSVKDWQGTLSIFSTCTPSDSASITSDNSSGSISAVADPTGKGITGKCTITAYDTLTSGTLKMTTASIEVAKLPIHVYVETSSTKSDDFGNLQAMSPGDSRSIVISGGVKPLASLVNVFPSILDVKLTNLTGGNFIVTALKPGIGAIRIIDGGFPPEKVTLTFLVQ